MRREVKLEGREDVGEVEGEVEGNLTREVGGDFGGGRLKFEYEVVEIR